MRRVLIRRFVGCGILAGLAAVACAHARPVPPPLADEMRGLFEVGYEAYDFRPCSPPDALARPVRPDPGVSLATTEKGGRGGFNSFVFYVRLRGVVDSAAAPDPTRRPRALRVHEVLEIRDPRRGECGWLPGRGLGG